VIDGITTNSTGRWLLRCQSIWSQRTLESHPRLYWFRPYAL